ncbi:YidB family protein [Kaistia nematophila]|uniref:YidB family protein n=1 Tax=Kaistia nematophila TaxID=2994654 RepID=A0A9X3E1S0_9HYPH|nr:YidB family protein [Kaistia nematophila]MCX5568153.1 YidB family protein [Kaistia nematophila]
MGIFDGLVGNVLAALQGQQGEGVQPDALGQALNGALANTQFGSLEGVLSQLQSSGLGAQVASWLGQGNNLPISADQLREALGNEELQKLGTQLGIPMDQVSDILAKVLPPTVDQLSPNGTLAPPAGPTPG